MPADFDISPIVPPVERRPDTSGTPSVSKPQEFAPPLGPQTSPSMPPPPNSNQLLKWLILVAAGLFVVSIASFWWGGNSFSASSVILSLEGPDRATSGDEVTYTVHYRNNTKVALHDLRFRLFYPLNAIVVQNGIPGTPDSEGFDVAQLNPGEEATKEFKLFMVGDKGEIKTARLHLIFNAGTLKSSFEKDVTVATTITTLPVTLTLVAPPTALSGQSVQYILDVRNDTQADLSDLKVVFSYPDGFTARTMQPTADTGTTEWKIASLKAGQGTRITVEGPLTGNPQEVKAVQVSLQHQLNDRYVDYVRTDTSTMISSPLLSVSIAPTGGRDYVSFPGDTLQYVIRYANGSRYTLLGMSLQVKLEGDMYDTARLQVQDGSFNEATNTITFDSSGVPALAQLAPSASGIVRFSIPLKAGFTGAAGSKSFFVKAIAQLSTPNVPTGLDISQVSATDSIITKIGTQPTLSESVLYDGGAGIGPLPLVVGQETTVTIRWQLVNPGNDLKDVKVVATLPPGVNWKNVAAVVNGGSAPTYDRNANKVTWSIGTLPFGTGTGNAKYEATFQVSVTPSSNQVGNSVGLTSETTLTGMDTFVGQVTQVKLRDYSTDDIEGHTGQGRVGQ